MLVLASQFYAAFLATVAFHRCVLFIALCAYRCFRARCYRRARRISRIYVYAPDGCTRGRTRHLRVHTRAPVRYKYISWKRKPPETRNYDRLARQTCECKMLLYHSLFDCSPLNEFARKILNVDARGACETHRVRYYEQFINYTI